MKYVYLLESIPYPTKTYSGLANDVDGRLKEHNAGESIYTRRYRPWRIVTYIAFTDSKKAVAFERYLKTASGRAFANKRLR